MAKRKKDTGWEDIGQMVGKKVEQEKGSWKHGWMKDSCSCHRHDSGFAGRLLFIIGVWIALDQLGLLQSVSFWVKVLIVVGFTLIRF